MTAPAWVRLTGRTLNKNSTTILSATAVAGVVATAVLAAKATLKARNQLYYEDQLVDTAPIEKAKIVWKHYIPPALAGTATIACIVGANQIGVRRQAAMLGAYTLADTAFREYKEEVVKQLTGTRERKVTDEIAKRKIDENPPPADNQVIITGGGEQLCYDTLSGRYFKSDIETIRQAANTVNREIVSGNMYASLNEFWDHLGLAPATLGEELGFNIDHPVELVFTSHLSLDGRACLAIGYSSLPIADYGKVF